jgi:hypothetical protein
MTTGVAVDIKEGGSVLSILPVIGLDVGGFF